jgi:sterol desaturase/sphingolipid hydroxylase (fatty acid hydroxylase superfamily)
MTEAEFQIVRAAGYVLALGVALALQQRRPHERLRGSWRINAGLWSVNLVVMGVVCGSCACTVARWAAAHEVGVLHQFAAPSWLAIPVTIMALDGVSYIWHRANHQLPWLWRFHRVHHSDPDFTVSTAVRFHPGELVQSLPLRLFAVAILGAPVEAVVALEVAFTLANFVEHGDIDLPLGLERALARVLVTPALHRRHHSQAVDELNTNFGTVFIVWDRLLGTFFPSTSAAHIRIGLANLPAPSIGGALALPFAYSDPRPR